MEPTKEGGRTSVAVFGSSACTEGQPLYESARLAGRELARAGLRVVTGGYGGVMEAASRGAREAGGSALGICSRIFVERRPNRHLSEVRDTEDLYQRTRELVDEAAGYLVLEGQAGTLAELAWLWALRRAGCLEQRPVVLLGERWIKLLQLLKREGLLEPSDLARTVCATSPAEAVGLLIDALHEQPENR